MKKLIAIMGLMIIHTIVFFRCWWLLNDRLLGIEMDYSDFNKWIHDDLRVIHDHLDDDMETTERKEPDIEKEVKAKKSKYRVIKRQNMFIPQHKFLFWWNTIGRLVPDHADDAYMKGYEYNTMEEAVNKCNLHKFENSEQPTTKYYVDNGELVKW